MERMMGVADNPLRRVLNYASEHFLAAKYPVLYILTVIGASVGFFSLSMALRLARQPPFPSPHA